jgi:hypothetical protein
LKFVLFEFFLEVVDKLAEAVVLDVKESALDRQAGKDLVLDKQMESLGGTLQAVVELLEAEEPCTQKEVDLALLEVVERGKQLSLSEEELDKE